MVTIILGALLIVAGIALAAARTASRGKLSDPHPTGPTGQTNTLEPRARGSRLGLKADLPGLALMIVGAVLLFSSFF